MISYMWQNAGRALGGSKSLHVLTILGVALGVASVLSIQVLNRNALAAFWGSVQAVSPEADLTILGRTPVFAESLYATVLGTPGVRRAQPIYRTRVSLAEDPDTFLEIVGLDLLQPTPIPLEGVRDDAATFLTARGWVAVTPSLATARRWKAGDAVAVTSGSRRVELTVGTFVDFQRITPLASRRLAVMDIAEAQALFGTRGKINQIDVTVATTADREAVARALERRLGEPVSIMNPEDRRAETAGILAAFRLNLTALSLISVFVGLFLVFGSTQASLVRRRSEFGVLRSLGATRGQLLAVMLSQVVLLGALGVAIGLPLGYFVAKANVDVVSATLTNIYLLEEIERVSVPFSLVLLAVATGIGGAVVGAVLPALDMARRDPNALLSAYTLHERLRDVARPLAAAGATILVLAALWYAGPGRSWQPAGFVLAVCLLLGLPLMTPLAIRMFAAPVGIRDFGPRFSIRSLVVRLQSTSVSVASLAVAVSMLAGITIMIGSFRDTVEAWIDSTVRADVYITSESWAQAVNAAPLDDGLVASLGDTPGVSSVDRLRGFTGYAGERRIFIGGVDASSGVSQGRFRLLDGDPDSTMRHLRDHDAVLISEPLARRLDRWVGDSVTLAGPTGPLTLAVAGVRYDYGNESGSVIMDLGTLERHYGPGAINSVALHFDPSVDVDAAISDLQARYRDLPLVIRSNRRLRAEVLTIFDQTFAITRILQIMCLLIAACGITLTLLILARERVSELALYRALGAARRQIFAVFVGKGFFMGALGMAMGFAGGVALAAILIFVVNRAYFGWTVQTHWPVRSLVEQALTILGAAVAASLYPAFRASRIPATELSRDDV